MESRRPQPKRRLATVAGLAALLLLVPTVGASAAGATRQVQMLDDCDPATFNAAIGPGTCVKDGERPSRRSSPSSSPRAAPPPGASPPPAQPRRRRHPAGQQPRRRGPHLHRGRQLRRRLHPSPQRPAGADPGAGVRGVPRRGLRRDAGAGRGHGDDRTAAAGNPPLRVPHPSLDADHRDRRLTIGTGTRGTGAGVGCADRAPPKRRWPTARFPHQRT